MRRPSRAQTLALRSKTRENPQKKSGQKTEEKSNEIARIGAGRGDPDPEGWICTGALLGGWIGGGGREGRVRRVRASLGEEGWGRGQEPGRRAYIGTGLGEAARARARSQRGRGLREWKAGALSGWGRREPLDHRLTVWGAEMSCHPVGLLLQR